MLLQVSDVQHNLPGPEDANHYLSSHCRSLSVPGTPGGRVVDGELPVASCPRGVAVGQLLLQAIQVWMPTL